MSVYQVWLLLCFKICLGQSQISIPDYLQECYLNHSIDDFFLPLNLRVLVDILRKAEKHSFTTMDMRTLSSSLLHRFKFDGIEYIEGVQVKDGILPYAATGFQRTKHKLMEELIPGNFELFPSEALTYAERCVLHRAISNTIIQQKSSSANSMCNQIGDKITGRAISVHTWDCPREYGVIFTSYGTIAPGPVIGAVAASLQPQSINLNQLLSLSVNDFTGSPNSNYNDDEVDLIVSKDEMLMERSMWQKSINNSSETIDNVWLATIAGDLAEMVVFQGPLVGSKMSLGATGFWNSTIRPEIYYLTGKPDNYDTTRAEIIGDVDGLIIAHNLPRWIENFNSLRLSQIIDMYYSNQGISYDTAIKACERKRAFLQVASKTILEEQTHVVSHLLAYYNSIAYISDATRKQLVCDAAGIFANYAEKHLFTEGLNCNKFSNLQVEILLAFDGAWTREYTMDFISVLVEDLDVSMFGSKIGVIHAATGEWLLNVTNSPSFAYQAIHNFTKISWPNKLNYTKTLETIFNYLNATQELNKQKHIIGNFGQAIVLLSPLTRISDNEQQTDIMLLHKIKSQFPDVRFLYYTSEYNAYLFKPFLLSEEDQIIKSLNIDDITTYLSTIPRLLRPTFNLATNVQEFKNQFEDYINPLQSNTYRLHQHWRKSTRKIAATFHTVGYGSITVCTWNQHTITGKKENEYCKDVGGHNDVTLTDYFLCAQTKKCPDIYYSIQNVTSLRKCAEMDCRTPDYVRYIVKVEKSYYQSSAAKKVLSIFLFLYPFVCLHFLN